jgi:hypothetical protein
MIFETPIGVAGAGLSRRPRPHAIGLEMATIKSKLVAVMWRKDMKRFYAMFALAVLALGGSSVVPARAAPPTVTPSPGYDARLQEQRAASAVYSPVVPAAKPVTRRHVKRTHEVSH